jgi:hypothetical protein
MAIITPEPPTQHEPPEKTPARSSRMPVRIGARESTTDRSTSRTLLAAVGVHLVVGLALVRLVALGHGFYDWFGLRPMYEKREERVTYVEAPKPKTVEPPKPVVKKAAVVRPPAPAAAPVTTSPLLPVAPMETPVILGSGFGSGDSSGTGTAKTYGINPALIGIAPANADPRVWAPGPLGINVPRTSKQMLDSVVGWAIASAADSLDSIARLYAPGRAAGDWTKRLKNGEKWGWDQTGLRLGKYTVPNALLALLPAGVQQRMSGNPIALSNARRLTMSRADIDRFSQQSMNEADFRKAVKELRVKNEREHEAKSRQKAVQKAASASQPPS